MNDFNLNNMYPNLSWKKNKTKPRIIMQQVKDIPKIIKFIPDTKIIINQDENNKRDCPKSGWIIKKNNTIKSKINVYRYFLYKL